MFINLSNHKTTYWKDEQLSQAKKYGELIDIEFPNVSPNATEEEIKKLAEKYFSDIVKITNGKKEESVIHLMGELTFTFTLVTLLLKNGYNCIASTTERKVVEIGNKKITQFEFTKFRKFQL